VEPLIGILKDNDLHVHKAAAKALEDFGSHADGREHHDSGASVPFLL
jgi:HEAT repeat protein